MTRLYELEQATADGQPDLAPDPTRLPHLHAAICNNNWLRGGGRGGDKTLFCQLWFPALIFPNPFPPAGKSRLWLQRSMCSGQCTFCCAGSSLRAQASYCLPRRMPAFRACCIATRVSCWTAMPTVRMCVASPLAAYPKHARLSTDPPPPLPLFFLRLPDSRQPLSGLIRSGC